MAEQRRNLHFKTFDQGLDEARRLAAQSVTTSGRYSYGQILEHLARTIDAVTGVGDPMPVPWYAKIFGVLLKRFVIHGRPRPGFKLPRDAQSFLWPTDEVSVTDGLEHLERSAEAFLAIQSFPKHPLFGQLSFNENHQLQCRHFELHLGFVHPSG
jgi:hypothetical protein